MLGFAATAVGAVAFGLVAMRLRLPGGPLVGSMIGAATVTVVLGIEVTTPPGFELVAFALVGMAVGIGATRTKLRTLGPYLVPAVGSALALIVVGFLTAQLLHTLGIAPPAAILATSPGALSVLISVALDLGTGEAEVAFFHLLRIITVILFLPVIVRFIPRDDDA